MRICSLFCSPRSPVSPPPKTFDQPDKYGLITTEYILYLAADEDLISACEYDILLRGSDKFPPNWAMHHPNIWLPLVPKAKTTHLSTHECLQFFVGLMHLHIASSAEMYKPPDGDGFSAMIKSVAYR
jgi:hypothetical protein